LRRRPLRDPLLCPHGVRVRHAGGVAFGDAHLHGAVSVYPQLDARVHGAVLVAEIPPLIRRARGVRIQKQPRHRLSVRREQSDAG
jgi:hypothetical protein